MKKIFSTIAICLLAVASFAVSAQTTRKVMTVVQKNGVTYEYVVDNVERVTISNETLDDLSNQFAEGDKVRDIKKAVLGETATYFVAAFFADANDELPFASIRVPRSAWGGDIDFQSTEGAGVAVDDVVYSDFKGSATVKFDKTGNILKVSLDGKKLDNTNVRCEYSGAYTSTIHAENVINADAVTGAYIKSPEAVGDVTTLALVSAKDDAKTYGVIAKLSAKAIYSGELDLATATDSYSLTIYDYAKSKTYTESDIASGKIISKKTADDNVFFAVIATLADGTEIEAEYYGQFTENNNIASVVPEPELPNCVLYYNADGTLTTNMTVGMALSKTSTAGVVSFYLYPEGVTSKYSSDKLTLQVDKKLINAGTINLANLAAGDNFQVKYSDIQLYSPETKYSGYSAIPNNGEMTITYDETTSEYSIKLSVFNKYNTPATGVENGGNNCKLVVSYKGAFGAY